mgnify:CR=1 FL=1
MYEASFTRGFELLYGPIQNYCIIGLLPSYLERTGSSLIYMVDHFIKKGKPNSGFFLNEYEAVVKIIQDNESQNQPTLLLGVTFALLEMIKFIPQQQWNHTIVMETGGMKGRKEEITKEVLLEELRQGFCTEKIYSEYSIASRELKSRPYESFLII